MSYCKITLVNKNLLFKEKISGFRSGLIKPPSTFLTDDLLCMKLVILCILLTNRIPISDNWIKDVVQESSGDPGPEYLVEIQKLVNALCEQVTLSGSQEIVSYFLLLGNFRSFLFSLDPKRMLSLETTHQHEQAEPSSHQKNWSYVQYLEDWNILQEGISNRIERVIPLAFP